MAIDAIAALYEPQKNWIKSIETATKTKGETNFQISEDLALTLVK